MTNDTLLPAYTDPEVKNYLIDKGASGTIYALVFPESRQILHEVLDGGIQENIINEAVTRATAEFNAGTVGTKNLSSYIAAQVKESLESHRQNFTQIFEAAWTSRQDSIHKYFFDSWKKWSTPVVTFSDEQWAYAYPTEGASKGLDAAINAYGQLARKESFEPTVHVFDGEYEGFSAYARAAHIKVVRHSRTDWKNAIGKIGPNDQFYISQPSAIDGNVWDNFDDFAKELYRKQPKAELMLDLTYVGSVAKEFHINADHPNIPTIFFSLSKPFGVYYHRIGGLISRRKHDSLEGNKWFKIAQSIQYGTALLERSDVYDLPRKYRAIQLQALENISERLDITLTPSDVLLFATAPKEQATNDIKKTLLRGSLNEQFMRVCLTPEMARLSPGAIFMKMDAPPILPPAAVKGISLKDFQP